MFFIRLTGVKSLPGFGAGAVRLDDFQDLGVFFQSSRTWDADQKKQNNETPDTLIP